MQVETIKNETINEIFHAPIEAFSAKWDNLDWTLLLKHVRENQDLFNMACNANWTYFERVKSRITSLTADQFQLVTINALNILARCNLESATNGLVYGEVQSGKTTSMTVLTALAFDLGFTTVVSLSGRINILRNQTQARTQESMHGDELIISPPTSRNNTPDRKRKRVSTLDDSSDESYDAENEEEYPESAWSDLGETLIDLNGQVESKDYMYWLTKGDEDVQNIKNIHVDELLNSNKLFAVLKKVPKSLESFVSFIEGDFDNSPWKRACKNNPEILARRSEIRKKLAEFRGGPALIIDDECDDASVAATQRQIEDKRGIPQRMVRLRHLWSKNGLDVCHYVGYSATPHANVLNNSNDEFFPHFFWELSTQKGLYLGSQMYLNEELKKRIIKLIPYEDYPNLDLDNKIQPSGDKCGLTRIQREFLEDMVNNKSTTESMKKFLAYYVFTGAIRLQRSRKTHDLNAIIAGQQGTTDPLVFFAHNDAELSALRDGLQDKLDNTKESYYSLSPKELRNLFNNFNTNYSEMLYKPNFKQSIILAKIEELITNRIILYIALDNGKFNTVTSDAGNTNANVYVLHYKGKFYKLSNALEETPSPKPLFHSGIVHASLNQDFIDLMHAVVTVAWSIVVVEINNTLNDVNNLEYLNEVWNDLSPDAPMQDSLHEIKKVLTETHIKTAMCRGGESITNMRTFDYATSEGDRTAKNKPVPRFLIVIGGNMLSRGLTVEGLTVSWYTRAARKSVADTTIQHQRWFGWRNGYIDLVRVFMQERHVQVFTEAVQSEQKLRNVFRQMALNNWRPGCRSAVLQEPLMGVLTNKVKNNVEDVKVHKFYELKTPALEHDTARAVLEATLSFWKDFSASVQHHRAGDVVMDVPLDRVVEYLQTIELIGTPNTSDLLRQIKIYQLICEDKNLDIKVNVGIPTRGEAPQEEFEEFNDENSQYILEHRLGLHKRRRNAVMTGEFDQLLGAKSQKSTRDKHQYIDAVVDKDTPLPDWIVTRDTENVEVEDAQPDGRGLNAPLLLLIYFLHPRFRGKGEDPFYPKDAPEAGQVPLVALAACFPDLKTGYVANRTVGIDEYVFPDDDDVHGRKRKRLRVNETQQTHIEDYFEGLISQD